MNMHKSIDADSSNAVSSPSSGHASVMPQSQGLRLWCWAALGGK